MSRPRHAARSGIAAPAPASERLRAADIDAELEAVPDDIDLSATIRALNQWQRQRPPRNPRRMHPLRETWLLSEARALRRGDPEASIENIAAALVPMLLDNEYERAIPEGAVQAWDDDRDRLLANDAKPLKRFLTRHL